MYAYVCVHVRPEEERATSDVAPSQVLSPSFLILDLSQDPGLPIRLDCLDPTVSAYFLLLLEEHITHMAFYTDAEGQISPSELLL